MKVKDLNERKDLQFISDSQDVQAIKDFMDWSAVEEFDSFFVKVQDGDYIEIYGMLGIIPWTDKEVEIVLHPIES